MPKTKLELTWPGKEERPRLEPRILLEQSDRGHHAARRREGDLFDNVLIKGDNLLALKALEQDYAGKVKCVFIDPPYNTGSAFEHYDDGIEHSLWLSLMRDRLILLEQLLSSTGSLWITVDDNESHYLKVLCDEIFGRRNFISNAVWQKKYTVANDARWLSDNHDHILVYAKNAEDWRPNRLTRSEEMNARYSNPDGHPKGPWKATPIHAKSGSAKAEKFSYKFKNGLTWSPPAGTFPRFSNETLRRMDEGGEIWFGRDGTAAPARKTFLSELKVEGPPAPTVWLHSDVGNNHEAREEAKAINAAHPFGTPKPERLLHRILHLATDPGDIVLDSFAGSGTTGAVAHKMGRRWIMIEIGDHADTHIVPRLTKVIDGEDQGGVTKAVGWEGGGGFRYHTLAPSLLERDAYDNWVIAPEYNGPMLAQAMCKHLGFTYDPAQDGDPDRGAAEWWRHGRSSERDFVYVTTQALTQDALRLLSEEVGPNRSLLVCARAFSGDIDGFENLTCRKIPATILTKCEWGRDDYSLQIAALPERETADDTPNAGPLFAKAPSNG